MTNKFIVMPSEDGRQFDFTVEGMVDGRVVSIHKRILFDDPDEDGDTNMALVDVLSNGFLSDSVRSGYGQAELIFATVADCLYTFLSDHLNETVYFEGSDPEGRTADEDKISLRQMLYNRALSKKENYEMANNYFVIYGVYKGGEELFTPNSQAKAFKIKLKK